MSTYLSLWIFWKLTYFSMSLSWAIPFLIYATKCCNWSQRWFATMRRRRLVPALQLLSSAIAPALTLGVVKWIPHFMAIFRVKMKMNLTGRRWGCHFWGAESLKFSKQFLSIWFVKPIVISRGVPDDKNEGPWQGMTIGVFYGDFWNDPIISCWCYKKPSKKHVIWYNQIDGIYSMDL